MIEVTWHSGKVERAKSAHAFLRKVRDTQWSRFNWVSFRRVMARRAKRWTGKSVRWWGDDEDFLRELERVELLRIDLIKDA